MTMSGLLAVYSYRLGKGEVNIPLSQVIKDLEDVQNRRKLMSATKEPKK